MAKATTSETADFLNELMESKSPVTVFLINGVKLQGLISKLDESSLLLKRDGHTQMVYKHAISTIMPVAIMNVEDIHIDVEKEPKKAKK